MVGWPKDTPSRSWTRIDLSVIGGSMDIPIMPDGNDPIADGEIIYRRIPTKPNFHDPVVSDRPRVPAFRPREEDTTGLSVFRAKYVTPRELTANERGARYFIACFLASDLRAHGIIVEPRPLPNALGHAEFISLRYGNRNTDAGLEQQRALADKVPLIMLGPFPLDASAAT